MKIEAGKFYVGESGFIVECLQTVRKLAVCKLITGEITGVKIGDKATWRIDGQWLCTGNFDLVKEWCGKKPSIDVDDKKPFIDVGGIKIPLTEESILQEAERITSTDRATDYGDMKASFDRIAGMWSALFGHTFTGKDVALAMLCLKISRATTGNKRDNWVDIAGYAKCGYACEAK
jgi:hypothetical protein